MAFLLAIPTTALFTAKFYNNCGFSIDVEFTAGGGRTTGKKSIAAGSTATSPHEPEACPQVFNDAIDNCGGATILLHKDGKKLAAEYGNRVDSTGTRKMWYNWSNDDGNPFLDRKRRMVAGAGCPSIDCAAGSDDCDYKKVGIESCSPDPYYVEVHVC